MDTVPDKPFQLKTWSTFESVRGYKQWRLAIIEKNVRGVSSWSTIVLNASSSSGQMNGWRPPPKPTNCYQRLLNSCLRVCLSSMRAVCRLNGRSLSRDSCITVPEFQNKNPAFTNGQPSNQASRLSHVLSSLNENFSGVLFPDPDLPVVHNKLSPVVPGSHVVEVLQSPGS
jgi:hypothetical protein